MTELVVLGFANRQLAEEARARSGELDREGALNLDGAALTYRRHDGRVEVVQPMRRAIEALQPFAPGGSHHPGPRSRAAPPRRLHRTRSSAGLYLAVLTSSGVTSPAFNSLTPR
jgi:hypothetical protein